MKSLLLILSTLLVLHSQAQQSNISCNEQSMKQAIAEIRNVKLNEALYLGKPLGTLLEQIKSEIKFVTANPSGSNSVRLGYFYFRFLDPESVDSIRRENKVPFGLVVYVEETFDWDIRNKPSDKKFVWTKEDAEQNANLTVL